MALPAPRALLVVTLAAVLWPFGAGVSTRDATSRQGVYVSSDQASNQPAQTRLIPVGTASISGVVSSADTGRPLAGARVTVSGTIAQVANVPFGGYLGNSGGAVFPGVSGRSGGVGAGMESFVNRSVSTDASGTFAVGRLPAGVFMVQVNRNQFLNFSYGERRPGGQGTPIALADGQQLQLRVALHRGGVISGTIYGEDNQPMPGAQAAAWRYNSGGGARRLNQVAGIMADDRGAFRIINLQPGDYLVSASPNFMMDTTAQDFMEQAIAASTVVPPSPTRPAFVTVTFPPDIAPNGQMPNGYLPTYYPGTTVRTAAATVHVGVDEERSGIDIPIAVVHATNVRGHVTVAPFDNVAVQLSLIPDDPLVQNWSGNRAQPDGSFTIGNVAPGTYTLLAQTILAFVPPMPPRPPGQNGPPTPPPTLPDAEKLWGRAAIVVNGERLITADLTLQPGKAVSGLVQFEMQHPPDLSRQPVVVTLTPAQGVLVPQFSPNQTAPVGPDGRFTFNGVGPGKYSLRVPGMEQSAMVNGVDSLDFPFEVTGERDITDAVLTVTDQNTEVSGTVADTQGQPALGATVLVVAADPKYWTPQSRRIQMVPATPQGRFTFRGLPPGDYLLSAVWDLEYGEQWDPDFVKTLTGPRVTVGEGAKVSQDLRIVR